MFASSPDSPELVFSTICANIHPKPSSVAVQYRLVAGSCHLGEEFGISRKSSRVCAIKSKDFPHHTAASHIESVLRLRFQEVQIISSHVMRVHLEEPQSGIPRSIPWQISVCRQCDRFVTLPADVFHHGGHQRLSNPLSLEFVGHRYLDDVKVSAEVFASSKSYWLVEAVCCNPEVICLGHCSEGRWVNCVAISEKPKIDRSKYIRGGSFDVFEERDIPGLGSADAEFCC
jgi:hypothetical protein